MNVPTILVIEDNVDDAALIVEGLSRAIPRQHIEVCANGGMALDSLRNRAAQAAPDTPELPLFALLDLGLPGLDGLEVLRAIRAEPALRLLPVTVLSASDRVEDIRAAARLGANSFVRKPGEGQQLVETLGQLARYWLELNIPPPCCGGQ
ncbi:MAG TPA: response regulator [Rhodocyclaceae bacterium]